MNKQGFAPPGSSLFAAFLFGWFLAWNESYSAHDFLTRLTHCDKLQAGGTKRNAMTQTVKNSPKTNGNVNPQGKDAKTIAMPQAKKEEPIPQPTLEQRIQKVEELRSLTEKRQRLIQTLHQLRTFSFASDDNCNLMLTDGQGQKFHTSNSTLIGLLKEYFMTLLNDRVSALDTEIMMFRL